MDEKKLGLVAVVSVVGIAYTIRRIKQLERLHDELVDLCVQHNDNVMQWMTDQAFADIVENFDE